MFGKKGSKILKLPPVRNCFTLAMTDVLVVITDSLKVPNVKKILMYEMKFLVPNCSCLQNPWLGGYRPPDPLSLCPQLNLLNPPRTKFLGTPLAVSTVITTNTRTVSTAIVIISTWYGEGASENPQKLERVETRGKWRWYRASNRRGSIKAICSNENNSVWIRKTN